MGTDGSQEADALGHGRLDLELLASLATAPWWLTDVAKRAIMLCPSGVDPEAWKSRLLPVVLQLVAPVASSRKDSKRLVNVIGRYVAFCDSEFVPLEVGVLCNERAIQRFIDVGCADIKTGSKATYQSILASMVKAHAKAAGDPVPNLSLREFGRRRVTLAYEDDELLAIRSAARRQRNKANEMQAVGIVALSAGAGESNEELIRARGIDVKQTPDGVIVDVRGRRARQTVVLKEFEEDVLEVAAWAKDGYVVGPGRRVEQSPQILNSFVHRIRSDGGDLPFEVRRLRATWIRRHLEAGTPLPVFMRAAGIETIGALGRYLAEAREPAASTSVRMLRSAHDGRAK